MTHPDQDIIDFLTKDLDLRAAPDWMIERARAFRDGGWEGIETAPHGKQVLLFCPDRGCPSNRERIELDYASQGSSVTTQAGRISNISAHAWATHWRPLPNPPKDTEQ